MPATAPKMGLVPGHAAGRLRRIRDAPSLEVSVIGAAPVADAAVPTLAFAAHASEPEGQGAIAIAISAHVYVERVLWRISDAIVPVFAGESIFELPILCAPIGSGFASAWPSSPSGSDAPLVFCVRGLVQCVDDAGRVATMQLSEIPEAHFDLPFATWRRALFSMPWDAPSPSRGVHA